eukprot:4688625-Alexandrium_andersonii.AAC.1
MTRGSRCAEGAGQAAPHRPSWRRRWCCSRNGAWPTSRRACGALAHGAHGLLRSARELRRGRGG